MAYMIQSGNQRTLPRWLADFQARDHMMIFPAKLDPAAFANYYGVDITLTANAAAGATSLAVNAIAPPAPAITPISAVGSLIIPTGSILVFTTSGTNGGTKTAQVAAPVYLGNTTIATLPIPTALVAATDNSKWTRYGSIYIPSGVLVGRMFTSRDSGTALFTPSAGTEDEMYLTMTDVADINFNNDVTLVRANAGINVKINYLPGYSTLAAGVITAINARYATIKGVN